jgi:hypothetical protein
VAPSTLRKVTRYTLAGTFFVEREDSKLARNNYSYERRQKDLAKRKKQEEKREEKRLRKLDKKGEFLTDEEGEAVDTEDQE